MSLLERMANSLGIGWEHVLGLVYWWWVFMYEIPFSGGDGHAICSYMLRRDKGDKILVRTLIPVQNDKLNRVPVESETFGRHELFPHPLMGGGGLTVTLPHQGGGDQNLRFQLECGLGTNRSHSIAKNKVKRAANC